MRFRFGTITINYAVLGAVGAFYGYCLAKKVNIAISGTGINAISDNYRIIRISGIYSGLDGGVVTGAIPIDGDCGRSAWNT